MGLAEELWKAGFLKSLKASSIYCRAFENNSGAIKMARLPRIRPRTKHININYHHFRNYVRTRKIQIYPIDTKWQIADIFTKPFAQNDFQHLLKRFLHF